MRRSAFALLFAAAAALTSQPASAQYCAAVVDNDSVRQLKSDMLKTLRSVATGDKTVNRWPGSTTAMLEVGADQGTMGLRENMFPMDGLALHVTLCAPGRYGVRCAAARTFFETAARNNHLKRYGEQEDTSFRYENLQTAYEELFKGRTFTLRPAGFEYQEWGRWYALPLGDARALYGSTTAKSGKKTNEALTGALHVSFIKVTFDNKESTNARAISTALENELRDQPNIQLTFSQVRCSGTD